MKVNRRRLRRILKEALDEAATDEHHGGFHAGESNDMQAAYTYNRMLTKVLSDITEEAIQFGNNPEVDAALDDIEAGMLRLKKAIIGQR